MKKHSISYHFFIGIDISKLSFDVTILFKKNQSSVYKNFANNGQGYKKFTTWLESIQDFSLPKALFCMEHTGLYTRNLVVFLKALNASVWMEASLIIKKSLGLNRGKNDKIDSMHIAEYSKRFTDRAILVNYTQINLFRLKDTLVARERLNKALKNITVAIKELTKIDPQQGILLANLQQKAMEGLKHSIALLEKEMMDIIKLNKKMNEIFNLATSIPGVGFILTIKLMVYTHLFTRFDNSRQLACYSGVAPFEHRSGTSVKGKTGVSKFANMDLKSTLHLASISAIQHNNELRLYYNRKVNQGKSKMSVINAVRNKLLCRVVSVVKRKTPYVQIKTNMPTHKFIPLLEQNQQIDPLKQHTA